MTAPRRGASITLSGRLVRVYSYASLVGPAMFTGAAEQARRCSTWRSRRCRDPDPGDDGEALETIGARAARGRRRCSVEEDGMRAAIDLVYRANVLAATEVLDS